MLTSLRIRNFKPWQDTRPIRLAPLTVFFGPNSSGKSSLNQFLLMLRQTAESPDRRRVFHTGDLDTPVDLGSFRDLVFGHQEEVEVSFSLTWKLGTSLRVEDLQHQRTFEGDRLTFEARVGELGRELTVHEMRYALGLAGETALRVGMRPEEGGSGRRYEVFSPEYTFARPVGKPKQIPPPVRFYGFPDEVVAYYQNAAFTSDLVLALERLLTGISYLGPLRDLPRRVYPWAGDSPEHVGWKGERSIEAILSARDRLVSPGPHGRNKPFAEVIARWLQIMGLIESFNVRPIGERGRLNEVVVRTPASPEDVLLTDVGFGVSQVLPVVVQCFYAPPGSTIILEQPEIHLHPAVQSSLADLFIEAIRAREGGLDRGVQIIVESHSEHFLRRLQRRIAEGLEPNLAALYFCEAGRAGSRIRELDLDLYGNIRNWPENFFGDPMEDVALQTEAGLERMIANEPEA